MYGHAVETDPEISIQMTEYNSYQIAINPSDRVAYIVGYNVYNSAPAYIDIYSVR